MITHGFLAAFAAIVSIAHAAPVAPSAPLDVVKAQSEGLQPPIAPRALIGFGGPLARPGVNFGAGSDADVNKLAAGANVHGSTPIGDICADASLNEGDRSGCQQKQKPKPSPATTSSTHSQTTTSTRHDYGPVLSPAQTHTTHVETHKAVPQPTHPATTTHHTTSSSTTHHTSSTPVTFVNSCKPNPALLHVGLDILGIAACIDVFGSPCNCDRGHWQEPSSTHTTHAAVRTEEVKPKKTSCGSGYRYSPVFSLCVALTPDAPKPDHNGECPSHWARDFELDVCVAISNDAPTAKDGKCPADWRYDYTLAACVSINLDASLGNHHNRDGHLLPAAARVVLSGPELDLHATAAVKVGGHEPTTTTHHATAHVAAPQPTCPPGHFLDAVVGCMADGIAIL